MRASYIVIAIAYMSASLEGARSSDPNSRGTRSSGAMNGSVPSNRGVCWHPIHGSGSDTILTESKSARHAVAGLIFLIRILV